MILDILLCLFAGLAIASAVLVAALIIAPEKPPSAAIDLPRGLAAYQDLPRADYWPGLANEAIHSPGLLCSLAFSVGLLALASPGMAQQSPVPGGRALSVDRSVSLVVPEGWTARTTDLPRGVKLFLESPPEGSADSFTENVYINEDRLADKHALNDYIEWAIAERRRRYGGFRILEDAPTQLGGRPARLVVTEGRLQGVTVVQISYYVERDRIAYSVNGNTLQSEYDSWGQRLKGICLTFKLE